MTTTDGAGRQRASDAAVQLRRARVCLLVFMLGLFVSGVTAFPLQTELAWFVHVLDGGSLRDAALRLHVLQWFERVLNALTVTNARFPFLAYGTDWLAFAHLVLVVLFLGPYKDPVKNEWVVTFGLIACAGILPLALIAGPVRGIPLPWRLIDCSFGAFGCIPLLICRRCVRELKRQRDEGSWSGG